MCESIYSWSFTGFDVPHWLVHWGHLLYLILLWLLMLNETVLDCITTILSCFLCLLVVVEYILVIVLQVVCSLWSQNYCCFQLLSNQPIFLYSTLRHVLKRWAFGYCWSRTSCRLDVILVHQLTASDDWLCSLLPLFCNVRNSTCHVDYVMFCRQW